MDITELIKQLGFPIAIAVLLLWFLYQVWKYTVRKIDEKDQELRESAQSRRTFNTRLLESQEKIEQTMNNTHNLLVEVQRDGCGFKNQ